METAAREMGPILSELRDIRGTLQRTLNSAERFEAKILGPRPPSPETLNKNPSESMRSMVAEILNLSGRLEKAVEGQHASIGDTSEGEMIKGAPMCGNPHATVEPARKPS